MTLIFELLTPKVDPFMPLICRPLVPVGSKIGSFVFKILCSQPFWEQKNERTDGQTNGWVKNIMSLPTSLGWQRLNNSVKQWVGVLCVLVIVLILCHS